MSINNVPDADWAWLYRIGAVAAVLVVLVGLIEIGISFLPGGERIAPESMTVGDWFALYQTYPLLGLRNLGLLNILIVALGLPFFGAVYGMLRSSRQAVAGLALIVFCVGAAAFFATNVAFPMLTLSDQYTRVVDDAQRAQLLAAGQTLLAIGASHSPGSFLGFFLSEIAGLLMSWGMLRDGRFGWIGPVAGLLAFVLLGLFDVVSAFVPALFGMGLLLAMGGGLASMVWYVLGARRLFRGIPQPGK
jgi:hypothetical protein